MRCYYKGVCKDGAGNIIDSATVSVYLYGTTTAASIYTTLAGATAVNSVTSGSDGTFEFWIDRTDYVREQCFDITIAKTGFTSVTWSNVDVSSVIRESGDYVQVWSQGDPAAMTDTDTITIANILTGIIVGTPTAAATYTLPTGTLCDVSDYFAINSCFDWSLINVATNATYIITLAGGTGHTIVGSVDTAANATTTGVIHGSTSRWRTRKTAANTFITYRIG